MNNFNLREVYFIDGHGRAIPIYGVKEIEINADDEKVESPSEKMMQIQKEFVASLSVQIDSESPFIKEIQNQHKKYLRDKAQYKFWKDQEFVGNNRAGRRRK